MKNDLAVRLALYGAVLAMGGSFSIMFNQTSGEALITMLGAALVGAAAGSAGGYRFVALVPVILVYTLTVVYGVGALWPGGWRELPARVAADAYSGAEFMYLNMVPYDPAPGIMLILVPVTMVLAAFSVSATLYEESPVISVAILGLTIGVISTVGFEVGAGLYFALFLACAVALLLFSGALEAPSPVAAGAGVVVVALGLAIPAVGQATPEGFIDWTSLGDGGTSRLSNQADVGEYLTEGRDAELLRVESSEPMLWRGGTLDRFDGARWRSTTGEEQEAGQEISEDIPTRYVQQEITVLNSRSELVFGGYKIQATSLPGARELSDGSWTAGEVIGEGTTYRVLSEVPQPTTEQLNAAGTDYSPYIEEKYLQMPGSVPAVVGQTADEIQRRYDPQTPYEQARAIERYLLYDGDFTYNLEADYRRADTALQEFLGGDGEGFCTQFATSMALMARDMGIPSRVVYGSTTGQKRGENAYVVTGSNMHTWVELYFPGVGWYPFNPTPGVATPTVMRQNAPRPAPDQSAEDPIAQSRAQAESLQQTPPETPPQQPEGQGNEGGSGEDGLPVWPLYPLGAVAAVGLVPLSKRLMAVGESPGVLYRDLAGRLVDILPPGKADRALSPSLTPNERMVALAEAAGLPTSAFKEFAGAYSEYLYGGSADGPRVKESYDLAVAQLRRRMPRWRRVLGWVNPWSIGLRARGVWRALHYR